MGCRNQPARDEARTAAVAAGQHRASNSNMNSDRLDLEWSELYGALGDVLRSFGVENAFGDGDYWIVDDNWGDPSHKVCVSRASFIMPALLAAVQNSLTGYQAWRVLLQIDEPLGTTPASSTGYTVRYDRIEPNGIA